uniref:Uncharacterized protein n=1 Tax=Ditylenchus dipsaci TaxID=166011 RepID=A0A915D445_9BILA
METIRALKQSIANFCLEVVQWRHFCTIPYLILLNFSFCIIAFYTAIETQIICLYGIVGCVLSTDLLLSSTHDHSVIREILYWPSKVFLKQPACVSVFCLIIYPVCKYHQVSNKICAFTNRVLAGLKELIINFVAVPILWLYGWATYLLCFRWLPGLRQYLNTCWLSLHNRLERVRQYLRVISHKMAEACKYFIYFYWWTDLRRWTNHTIIQPVLKVLGKWFNIYIYEPVKSFLRKVVYIVGCYWLVPVFKEIGRYCASVCKSGADLLKQASIALCQAFAFMF